MLCSTAAPLLPHKSWYSRFCNCRIPGRTVDCINNPCSPDSPPRERYHIRSRSIGAADVLQLSLVRFAAFENNFCGQEQECPRINCGTFSADDAFKFSEEVGFCGLHSRIVELRVK